MHEVSVSHTHTHTTTTHHNLEDSSGRVISLLQRPLRESTQHPQQTDMPPVGFEPTISASELAQNYALERAATATGGYNMYTKNYLRPKIKRFAK